MMNYQFKRDTFNSKSKTVSKDLNHVMNTLNNYLLYIEYTIQICN